MSMSIPTVSVQLDSPITASSSSTLTLEVSTSYRPSRTAQLTPSRASHGTAPVARTMAGCTWCTRSSRRTKATTPTFTSAIRTMTARLGARVNDDNTKNSQLLPKISLDPTTGNIAVIWYDARDDLGTGGAGDTDGIPNTDAQVWGAFSTDGGQTFTKNIQISAGTSNSHDAQNGIDYGDYSGLSFYRGIAHPAWSDNSNSTGNNPDGTLHQLDIYSASVPVRWR